MVEVSSPRPAEVETTRQKRRGISWRIFAEGTGYGNFSMLIAEEPVLSRAMVASWILFLIYLICRCSSHYFPNHSNHLHRIGKPCRIAAWFLIVSATVIAGSGT
jgi:hypothetical protein